MFAQNSVAESSPVCPYRSCLLKRNPAQVCPPHTVNLCRLANLSMRLLRSPKWTLVGIMHTPILDSVPLHDCHRTKHDVQS